MEVAKAEGGGEPRPIPTRRWPRWRRAGRLTEIAKRFKPGGALISGCQDNQSIYDGDHNGAFTGRC